MFETTQELTSAAGLPVRFQIVGQESRHNLIYWNGIIWIWSGAHGRLSKDRFVRNADVTAWGLAERCFM